MDEADEEVNPDIQTIKKVFDSIGGFKTIVTVAFLQLIMKSYHWYDDAVKNEFAMADPEV